MGGTIKVAIRLHDGSVTSDTRWTNNMPTWINSIEMVNDDAEYLRAYAHQPSDHRGDDHTIAPYGYGLVLIDAITHTIYSCNGYSQPGQIIPAKISNHEDDPESVANWKALMDAGRLSAVDGHHPDVPPIILPMVPGRGPVEEAYALRELEGDWKSPDRRFYDINIDLSPWRVIDYRESREGCELMRLHIKDSGFPFTEADDRAWDEYMKEKFDEDEDE